MSIIRQIKGAQKTFGDIAKLTFNTMMAAATWYVDVYRNNSMKNIEWVENNSATTAVRFNQILPTHEIQQWR